MKMEYQIDFRIPQLYSLPGNHELIFIKQTDSVSGSGGVGERGVY